MSGLKKQRTVFLVEMRAGKNVPQSVEVDFEKLLGIAKQYYDSGKARGWVTASRVVLQKGDATNVQDVIFIADMNLSDDSIAMVFTRGLPDDSLPSWLNLEDLTAEELTPPSEGVVPAKSAHLILQKKSTSKSGKGPTYRAGYDRNEGVSRGLMMGLLNAILADYQSKNTGEFTFDIQKKQKGTKAPKLEIAEYTPIFRVVAHASDDLKEDIKEKRIRALELTLRDYEISGTDRPKVIHDVDTHVRVNLTPTDDAGILKKAISWVVENVRKSTSSKIAGMRLVIDTAEGQRKAPLSAEALTHEDAFATLYCSSQIIHGFSKDLPGCFSSVDDEIRKKIEGLINDGKLW
jgi:hypothetical protein